MQKHKLWQTVLLLAGAGLAAWLLLWLLGPVLLPFVLGFLAARAADPAVRSLQHRLGLPRWAAAGLCVSAIYAVLALGLWLLCRILCREAKGFLQSLPALAQSLSGPVQRLEARLLALAGRFPDGIGKALEEGVSDFFRSGAGLGGRLYNWLFSFASRVLMKLPDIALFLLTVVLSSFMLASELPRLQALWVKKAPPAWQRRVLAVVRKLKDTLGSWLQAQLKLMTVTFLLLTAGFLILRVDYPLLFGLAIALIDALPVLGSGTILIPWGLMQFLRGQTFLGVGLLCLYGAAALTRTALEPRMLGKQMGLDPLLTLLALYAGYHFLGILGMILFPIGALLARQFWDHMEKKHEP